MQAVGLAQRNRYPNTAKSPCVLRTNTCLCKILPLRTYGTHRLYELLKGFRAHPPLRRRVIPASLASSTDDKLQYDEAEVEDLITDAASFICVMDELRPLDPSTYNPFYEVWTRIERIPPQARHRLLDELEPGSLRSLWRASMARYVLDEARSLELFADVSVWDDYPTEPGQVFTYEGRCERYELEGPQGVRFQKAVPKSSVPPGVPISAAALTGTDPYGGAAAAAATGGGGGTPAAPWLRVTPGSFEVPVTRFKQAFFVALGTGTARGATLSSGAEEAGVGGSGGGDLSEGLLGEEEVDEEEWSPRVFSRVVLPMAGPIDRWWEPIYCRLQVGLTLTPLSRDAGADLQLLYPADPECARAAAGGPDGGDTAAAGGLAGWPLLGRDWMPPGGAMLWPEPDPEDYAVSPFSGAGRDYMRVAGPGVYVGCAYRRTQRRDGREEIREEDCVYFVIARRL